jgi:DNA-binding CsgD family transcriptional regulator
MARKALCGEWEIVAEFVHEGHAHVVLRAMPRALTSREREVLSRAALGETCKVMAYELGVADSTVRVLMARACRRLGVASRREAIEAFLALTRTPDTPTRVCRRCRVAGHCIASNCASADEDGKSGTTVADLRDDGRFARRSVR